MIVDYKPNHSDHEQALTTLLETTGRYHVKSNYEKLQYKEDEFDFIGETYTTSGQKSDKIKVYVITAMPAPTIKKHV